MENCTYCGNSPKLLCSDCNVPSCTPCLVLTHLSPALQSHNFNHLCEECEEETAVQSCDTCDQAFCLACDTKIHNKGKRALHTRTSLPRTSIFSEIRNIAYLSSNFCEKNLKADNTDPEALKAKIVDLVSEMGEKTDLEHKISLIVLESENTDQTRSQLLKDIDLKNLVILCGNLNEISSKSVCSVPMVLNYLKDLESIFIYDTKYNSSIRRFFSEQPISKVAAIFHNFDQVEEKALENSTLEQIFNFKNELASIDIKAGLEGSEESISDDSFENSKFKNLLEGFSRQDSSIGIFEQESMKENIDPNQSLANDFFKTSPEEIIKRLSAQNSMSMNLKKRPSSSLQPLIDVQIQGSAKIGERLQQELMKFAEKGELLVSKEIVISKVMEVFRLKSLREANNILAEAENKKVIHTTIRKFLYNGPYIYIGMLLSTLTLESLTWVIRSIKNDLMTPTEKLVVSRIKECYGLKIDQDYWKSMLKYISGNQNLSNEMKAQKIWSLCIRQISDPVTNMETSAIYLSNEEWIPEDQGVVDENTGEWRTFLAFIEDFFNENLHSNSHYKETEDSKWSNSVENVTMRSGFDQERCFKVTEDMKAIPGGRYGCAQFIKYCGPDNLKRLSIGRLTLLVQEAINKGIIRYQKTLLVRNTANDSIPSQPGQSEFETEVLQSINSERKAKLLSMVKEALLQILMEKDNANGVSLAQIPFYLKRKLKFPVDFQDLGYPKLKNFLSTLKNLIEINSMGANHTYVKLKTPLSRQFASQNFNKKPSYPNKKSFHEPILVSKPPLVSNSPSLCPPLRRMENGNIQQELNNDLSKLLEAIDRVMKENSQGLLIQDLERKLCEIFTVKLSFQMFGCLRFYDFIVEYADQVVDVEAKKDGFIIYPKSSNFWHKGGFAVPHCIQGQAKNPFPMTFQKYQTPSKQTRSEWSVSGESTVCSDSRPFIPIVPNNEMKPCIQVKNQVMMGNFNINNNNYSTPNTGYAGRETHEIFADSPMGYSESPFNGRVSNWNANFGLNNAQGNGRNVRNGHQGQGQGQGFKQTMQLQPDFDSFRFIEELLQEGEVRRQTDFGSVLNSNTMLNQAFNVKSTNQVRMNFGSLFSENC